VVCGTWILHVGASLPQPTGTDHGCHRAKEYPVGWKRDDWKARIATATAFLAISPTCRPSH
jgi:hypothetical protein